MTEDVHGMIFEWAIEAIEALPLSRQIAWIVDLLKKMDYRRDDKLYLIVLEGIKADIDYRIKEGKWQGDNLDSHH